MSREREVPVRIVYRRKRGGHGHHGGAWKVAFADFMTAMFAMFLVLWLVNQSSDVKSAIAGYFQDPLGRANEFGSSILPGEGAQSATVRVRHVTEVLDLRRDRLSHFARELREQMEAMPELAGVTRHVEITLTEDGLRIELLEDAAGVFFETGIAVPSERGQAILGLLGRELGRLGHALRIEGHTDAHPYAGAARYTNWELSAERANAARRIMSDHGLGDAHVAEVRGLAHRQPRDPADPFAPRNRRISITVLLATDPSPEAATAADADAAGATEPRPRLALPRDVLANTPVSVEPPR